jgi:hypothetical protein
MPNAKARRPKTSFEVDLESQLKAPEFAREFHTAL